MTKDKEKSKSKKEEKEESKKDKKDKKDASSSSSDNEKKKKKKKRSSSSSGSSSKSKGKKRKRSKSSKKKRSKSEKKAAESTADVQPGPDEFLVVLDMTTKKGLGIEVDWANGKSLFIKGVKPEGHIPDWNKEHPPAETVMAEDHIIAVNGKAGDPKTMLNECRTSTKKLKLLVWAHCARSSGAPVAATKAATAGAALASAEAQLQESLAKAALLRKQRAAAELSEFLVSLDMRRHASLGLDCDWQNAKLLYIKALMPGAIEEWNRTAPPDRSVHPGDTVVAVNGYAGDSRGMAGLCKELCSAQSTLQLRVRGPPLPPPGPAPKLQIAT